LRTPPILTPFMARDPIVDEVRAVKVELAARFNFDVRAIVWQAVRKELAPLARAIEAILASDATGE